MSLRCLQDPFFIKVSIIERQGTSAIKTIDNYKHSLVELTVTISRANNNTSFTMDDIKKSFCLFSGIQMDGLHEEPYEIKDCKTKTAARATVRKIY